MCSQPSSCFIHWDEAAALCCVEDLRTLLSPQLHMLLCSCLQFQHRGSQPSERPFWARHPKWGSIDLRMTGLGLRRHMSHEPVVIPDQMHQGARVAVWPDVELGKCPAHLGLKFSA